MKALPSFDAHAHIDPVRSVGKLAGSGAVLTMSLSLDEAARTVGCVGRGLPSSKG